MLTPVRGRRARADPAGPADAAVERDVAARGAGHRARVPARALPGHHRLHVAQGPPPSNFPRGNKEHHGRVLFVLAVSTAL